MLDYFKTILYIVVTFCWFHRSPRAAILGRLNSLQTLDLGNTGFKVKRKQRRGDSCTLFFLCKLRFEQSGLNGKRATWKLKSLKLFCDIPDAVLASRNLLYIIYNEQ